jgi:hypothetical protein
MVSQSHPVVKPVFGWLADLPGSGKTRLVDSERPAEIFLLASVPERARAVGGGPCDIVSQGTDILVS